MELDVGKTYENFERAIEEYKQATELTKQDKARKLASQIDLLALTRNGIKHLYNHSIELEESGIFEGTPWNEPKKLVPPFVKGTLQSGHPSSSFEILSDLRMLAYARGKAIGKEISEEEATEYINHVLVLNLEFAFEEPTEESRLAMSKQELKKAYNLFGFLLSEMDITGIQDKLIEEVRMICEQRPIVTRKAREMIHFLHEKMEIDPSTATGEALNFYYNAAKHPSLNSRKYSDPGDYEKFLRKASPHVLEEEAREMGRHMNETGIASNAHAALLRWLVDHHPSMVPLCLYLNENGAAEWEQFKEHIRHLILDNILPGNSQCIYGLAKMMEKNLFTRGPVRMGLENMRKIRLDPNIEKRILKSIIQKTPDITALQYLIGATFRVLGQPLGVGQGANPTCQSARGISMWSQHTPARLINLIITAATQNNLVFRFEGQELSSRNLGKGLLDKLDYSLDAVSITLVPHLDKIYFEMMTRAAGRGEDPHKWVNPAMYGNWIQVGFASAYDYLSNSIFDFQGFLRIFYAGFHLDYNGQNQMVYPNPVGIFITSARGEMVGFHAVSLLRVAKDPDGEMRAYFLNPNNEGRQNWGQGIEPSVSGNGEEHGESSLPFHLFAARLYAFHYNDFETVKWMQQVPREEILRVEKLARESWGKSYLWNQQPKKW